MLQRDVLEMIEPGGSNASIEHDVFPQLPTAEIYAYDADGYWLDLGTPERYMDATRDLLDRKLDSWLGERLVAGGLAIEPGVDTSGCQIEPPAVIAEGCELGAGTRIGMHTVLGHGCEIGENCELDRAVLQRGCRLGEGVSVTNAILGPGVQLGAGATVCTGSVIGEGAVIEAGVTIGAGSRVEAGATAAA